VLFSVKVQEQKVESNLLLQENKKWILFRKMGLILFLIPVHVKLAQVFVAVGILGMCG